MTATRDPLRRVSQIAANRGCADGFDAVAVLDRKLAMLAVAGSIEPDDARSLCVTTALWDQSDRKVHVELVADTVFVVVVCPVEEGKLSLVAYENLRRQVEVAVMLAQHSADDRDPFIPPSDTGGGSSGPAALQVVEVGVTVPRGRN